MNHSNKRQVWARRTFVCNYVYRDEHGIARFSKTRWQLLHGGKTFSYEDAAGWPGKPKAWNHLVFRLPELLEGLRAGRTLYICEGEKDALAAAELGYVATTHHGGRTVATGMGQWFRGAARVIIVMDHDLPGAAIAVRWYQLLTGEAELDPGQIGIYRPRWHIKDLTDWLSAGHTVPELRPVPITDLEAIVPIRNKDWAGYGHAS